MAQKNATPSVAQKEELKKAGLSTLLWTVVKEFPSSMIVRHRTTGEFKLIEKGEKTI